MTQKRPFDDVVLNEASSKHPRQDGPGAGIISHKDGFSKEAHTVNLQDSGETYIGKSRVKYHQECENGNCPEVLRDGVEESASFSHWVRNGTSDEDEPPINSNPVSLGKNFLTVPSAKFLNATDASTTSTSAHRANFLTGDSDEAYKVVMAWLDEQRVSRRAPLEKELDYLRGEKREVNDHLLRKLPGLEEKMKRSKEDAHRANFLTGDSDEAYKMAMAWVDEQRVSRRALVKELDNLRREKRERNDHLLRKIAYLEEEMKRSKEAAAVEIEKIKNSARKKLDELRALEEKTVQEITRLKELKESMLSSERKAFNKGVRYGAILLQEAVNQCCQGIPWPSVHKIFQKLLSQAVYNISEVVAKVAVGGLSEDVQP